MRRLWPILLLLISLNCRAGSLAVVEPVSQVEVHFQNYTWDGARLYIMQGGYTRQAGSASGNASSIKHVRIPGTGAPIRFFVRFTAGSGFETWLSPDLFWVFRGTCVVVRLENNTFLSSVIPCKAARLEK